MIYITFKSEKWATKPGKPLVWYLCSLCLVVGANYCRQHHVRKGIGKIIFFQRKITVRFFNNPTKPPSPSPHPLGEWLNILNQSLPNTHIFCVSLYVFVFICVSPLKWGREEKSNPEATHEIKNQKVIKF